MSLGPNPRIGGQNTHAYQVFVAITGMPSPKTSDSKAGDSQQTGSLWGAGQPPPEKVTAKDRAGRFFL